MRVLVACEFSGVVRDAFRRTGHDAWSVDLLECEPSLFEQYHFVHDAVTVACDDKWDLMIAHPPCTYLSRAGYHWCNRADSAPGMLPLKGRPRREAMLKAAEFFRKLLKVPVKRIAVENPRPIVHAQLPLPSQTIQPWQFGHGEMKATCLWLDNLPLLEPTIVVEGRVPRVHHASPGENRWKERSRTLPGIAEAMADQWGNL